MLISKDKLYDLKNQIVMSRKMNEEELQPIVQENVHRYIGSYVPQFAADWDINLNEVYPIIQANLPAIFFRNPRVFMKPGLNTSLLRNAILSPVKWKRYNLTLQRVPRHKRVSSTISYLQ